MRIGFIRDRDGIGVVKHRNRIGHPDTVLAKIDPGFARLIPLEPRFQVYVLVVHTSILALPMPISTRSGFRNSLAADSSTAEPRIRTRTYGGVTGKAGDRLPMFVSSQPYSSRLRYAVPKSSATVAPASLNPPT